MQAGNGIDAQAIPGPKTRTNVTVQRPYQEMAAFLLPLEGAINGAMHASFTLTDANGNPNATRVTRTGLLKEVQTPGWDAKSGEPAFLALVMECNV